jgi:1A family penicillin-binding protein
MTVALPPGMTWKIWVALAVGAILLLLASGWYTCGFRGCPDPEALLALEPGEAPEVLDQEGESFARLLPVDREVVALDSLPDHVGHAFIAVEDRRFRRHRGVDLRRAGGALFANIRQRRVAEGGSTITMQLARNAFPERLPAAERTPVRKVLETRVAWLIERTFDKDEILGLYLNQIYFGNGATGIAAAARHYFGVSPARLTVEQSALLAAMVKAPSHYDPREETEAARERLDLVLGLMGEAGYLTPAEVAAARAKDIVVIPRRRVDRDGEALVAPWFLEAVRRRLDGLLGSDMYGTGVRVHTTLDPALQRAAEEALHDQLRRIESGEYGAFQGPQYDPDQPPDAAGAPYLQGAVVVLDVATGGVLALVGGRNIRHSAFDHVFNARRQVGSAFKPFVYGAAVAGGIAPSHPLEDAPLTLEVPGAPTYEPTNFDNEFHGMVTARQALRDSRNVPAVRLAQEVGTDVVAGFARQAGLEAEIPESPSMALGTVALSPMELAVAYATLAGLGRGVEPRFIRRVESAGGVPLWAPDGAPESERRIEPEVAYVLNDMLQDVIDGGTGSAVRAAGFRGTAAGKTGTTQESADAWFVGYTPEVIAVVWIGFDLPAPILPGATGGGLAAPVWGRMMAMAGRSGGEWDRPASVVRMPYDPATGRAVSSDCAGASRAPSDLFLRTNANPTCPANLMTDPLAPADTAAPGPGDPEAAAPDTATAAPAEPPGTGPPDTLRLPDHPDPVIPPGPGRWRSISGLPPAHTQAPVGRLAAQAEAEPEHHAGREGEIDAHVAQKHRVDAIAAIAGEEAQAGVHVGREAEVARHEGVAQGGAHRATEVGRAVAEHGLQPGGEGEQERESLDVERAP